MANEKTLIYKEDLRNTVLDHFGMDLAYYGKDLQFCQEAIDMAPAVDAVEVVQSRVGDTIFEVDPEHGVVKHEVYEVCVVYKTTATDDNGMVWDDFYTSDDIDTAYKTRQEAEANFCSYGERREGE